MDLWGNLIRDPSTGKTGIIIGEVGSGKSTLSSYLYKRGFWILADDHVHLYLEKTFKGRRLVGIGSLWRRKVTDRSDEPFILSGTRRVYPVDFVIALQGRFWPDFDRFKYSKVLYRFPDDKTRRAFLSQLEFLPRLVFDRDTEVGPDVWAQETIRWINETFSTRKNNDSSFVRGLTVVTGIDIWVSLLGLAILAAVHTLGDESKRRVHFQSGRSRVLEPGQLFHAVNVETFDN